MRRAFRALPAPSRWPRRGAPLPSRGGERPARRGRRRPARHVQPRRQRPAHAAVAARARSPSSRGRRTATGSRSSGRGSSRARPRDRAILTLTAGERTPNPAWSADGTTIAFRRGARLSASRRRRRSTPSRCSTLCAPHDRASPGRRTCTEFTAVVAGRLLVSPGLDAAARRSPGVPAWAPDKHAVAFATRSGGLSTIAPGGQARAGLWSAPAGSPRWSPDSSALVYAGARRGAHAHARHRVATTPLAGVERAGARSTGSRASPA